MKKLTTMLLTASLGLALTACGGSEAPPATEAPATSGAAAGTSGSELQKPASPLRYSLGSGSSGGNFYLVGGGVATVLNNTLPDYFVITSEETGGSTANLTMLQNDEAEIGISMTSSLAEAWAGEADWTGGKMDKIRGIAPLYPSYMTIYALKSSNIQTLTDLNGKVVGLGSKGAAMDSVLREGFEQMEIRPASIFNDGHGATASAVADGQLNAAVLFSYPPFSAITELEATQDLNFISLTEDEQNQLTELFPFYSPDLLPAGSYKGVTEDIRVVSEWNMLVGSSEVSADYGYLIAKTIFESNPELIEIHKSLSYATPENCLHYNIPLHAGTVRYLKEIGVAVPAELIPEEYTE